MLAALNRWKHFTAMALVGDGVLAMVRPRRDAREWTMGPRPWRKLMHELHEHPTLTRVLGGVQAAAALYWILADEKREHADTE